jgi:hypothetical protein
MAFPFPNPNSPGPGNEREFEGLVANLFRRYGWGGQKKEHSIADKDVDFAGARQQSLHD